MLAGLESTPCQLYMGYSIVLHCIVGIHMDKEHALGALSSEAFVIQRCLYYIHAFDIRDTTDTPYFAQSMDGWKDAGSLDYAFCCDGWDNMRCTAWLGPCLFLSLSPSLSSSLLWWAK